VENVAYPEGTCAEAGAIAAMVAAGETELIEVAVIADSPAPVPPCGGCRQKLAEFGRHDTPVALATTDGKRLDTTVGDLLPGRFEAAHMGRRDRKSTRLNSSHVKTSYAVLCLKKKKQTT